MEEALTNDVEKKILTHIATLEQTNKELLNTLKKYVELLTEFTPSIPDPHAWQDMLNTFQETIKVEKRIVGEKIVH
jgi:hypothetical protein